MRRLWLALECAFALQERPESCCPDEGLEERKTVISCLELSVTKFFLDHLFKKDLQTLRAEGTAKAKTLRRAFQTGLCPIPADEKHPADSFAVCWSPREIEVSWGQFTHVQADAILHTDTVTDLSIALGP